MNSNKTIAIIVGALFLLATATFFTGDTLIGNILRNPDYLNLIADSQNIIVGGALLEFIDGLAIVGIAVLMYPLLKKQSASMALGYVGFRITEFAIILVYLVSPLLLITVGLETGNADGLNLSALQSLGEVLQAQRFWSLRLIYVFNGVAGLMFAYLMYRAKLIPRALSILGIVGYGVLLLGTIPDMFGLIDVTQGTGMLAVVPGGLFELILPFWLFVKGFSTDSFSLQSSEIAQVTNQRTHTM